MLYYCLIALILFIFTVVCDVCGVFVCVCMVCLCVCDVWCVCVFQLNIVVRLFFAASLSRRPLPGTRDVEIVNHLKHNVRIICTNQVSTSQLLSPAELISSAVRNTYNKYALLEHCIVFGCKRSCYGTVTNLLVK